MQFYFFPKFFLDLIIYKDINIFYLVSLNPADNLLKIKICLQIVFFSVNSVYTYYNIYDEKH